MNSPLLPCLLQDYLSYQINLTMLTQSYPEWGGEPLSDKNKLHLAQINRLVTLVGTSAVGDGGEGWLGVAIVLVGGSGGGSGGSGNDEGT